MLEKNIDMIVKLNSAFKNITYQDSSHTYYCGDKRLTSVTQFLGTLKEKFDKEYWSTYKAFEFSGYPPKYNWKDHQNRCFRLEDGTLISLDGVQFYIDSYNLNVTPEDVQEQWYIENVQGTERGSYIHNYLECKEQRLLDLPKMPYIESFDTIQTIKFYNSIKAGTLLADEFLTYSSENLIPVALEYIVGDPALGLAGRFDRLYWSIEDNEYQIWDFKTDKKIDYTSSKKMDVFGVSDCTFEKYSLQTSLYKYIIESNINEKIGQSKIVYFDIRNKEWSIIPTTDYSQLIKEKSDEISFRNNTL